MKAPDVASLREKLFADAVAKFEELHAQGGPSFLIGAACIAGMPLIAELIRQAVGSGSFDHGACEWRRFMLSKDEPYG